MSQGDSGGSLPGELEVLVVCNGCSDSTAAIARSCRPEVEVLELPSASKAAALNYGDQRATGFPRFYVDADVEVSIAALRKAADALRAGEVLAVSVRPELMLDECSWGVRSYYRIWARLPQMADGLTGAGVYGVSEAGRSRFAAFPDVIADDTYITCLFAPGERKRITSVSSTVRPSRSFRELVATRVRVHLGILQVRRRQVQEGSRTGSGGHAGWLQVIRREPPLVFDLPAYLAVTAWAKLLAGRRLGRQRDLWARAETSRAHHG